MTADLLCDALRKVFQFFLAHDFFVPWYFAQKMDRVLQGLFRFLLPRFAEQEMDLELLLLPRLIQRYSSSQPAVCFFTNAVGVNQIKRNRFVEMPDVILPGKIEVVLII